VIRGERLVVQPEFQDVVRQVVCPLRVEEEIFVVCKGWPSWLMAALALGLPVMHVFCPQRFHGLFVSAGYVGNLILQDLVMFQEVAMIPRNCFVLASGDINFFGIVRDKMYGYQGRFVYSVDVRFEHYEMGSQIENETVGFWVVERGVQYLKPGESLAHPSRSGLDLL
jgi:hypothetical protein